MTPLRRLLLVLIVGVTIAPQLAQAQAPVFTTGAAPSGLYQSPYFFQLAATGSAPINFVVSAGSLPPGLTLVASGRISGTPTTGGTYVGSFVATNAAGQAFQSFSIGITGSASQTINFLPLGNRAISSGAFLVGASASSGLGVTFSSLTATVCTVVGNTVSLISLGLCSVRASQPGNATFAPAPNLDRSFSVTIALPGQTIIFGAIGDRALGTAPFPLTATVFSGLTVSFASLTPATCTVAFGTVTLIAVGNCSIRATQNGNNTYAAAPLVDRSFMVTATNQTLTFAAAIDYATGSYPTAIAVGDFNGDGKSDLVIVNQYEYNASVYMGNGDGTFARGVTLATGAVPASVAVGDLNGDGQLDIAVTNILGNSVTIYFGNGNGTFRAPLTLAVGRAPYGIAITDLNRDGKLDLVVTNSSSGSIVGQTVAVLLGNGDGAFRTPITYVVGINPQGVAIGDFNGDGKPDLAVSNASSSNVSILLGNGDGTFRAQVTYPAAYQPTALAAIDFSGDGNLDLVIITNSQVSILLGRGDGTFGNATNYRVANAAVALAVADLNGDAWVDLAVTHALDNTVGVLLGNGDGTFQPEIFYPTGAYPAAVLGVDLTGDGTPDLVIANHQSNTASVLRNTTTFSMTVTAQAGTPQSANVNTAYATALAVLVRDGAGVPQSGIAVTFNAPSSVASGTFSVGGASAQVTSNALGIAIAPIFSANAYAGSFSVIAHVANASASFALSNIATSQAPSFISAPPANGTRNVPYSYTLSASGMPVPSYAVLQGVLPAGLMLNGTTGVIAGTPTTVGIFAGVLAAANGLSPSATQSFSISVSPAPQAPLFASTAPPNGTLNTTYSFVISASGTPTPIFGISSGNLPPGLTLAAATGIIGGTPTAGGAFSGVITATNGVSPSATQAFAITINTASQAPLFTSGALSNPNINTPYSFTVTATGNPVPSFSVSSGNLPPGLALNASTGVVSGTPSAFGTFSGVLTATNGVSPSATQAFAISIAPAVQSITFGVLDNRAFGPPFTVVVTATSGLQVTLESLTTTLCTASGATVTMVDRGTCTIRASQPGDATYSAATDVDRTFNISTTQTINFAALGNKVIGDGPFAISATATSGLIVGFSSLSAICTVSGNTVTLVAAGYCTVRASQAGNAGYFAAASLDQGFTVRASRVAQTISFTAPSDQRFATPPFNTSATASSGLSVSFASLTPSICVLNGSSVTVIARGACTIRASQAGNADYAVALNVDQSFNVTTASQTISFPLDFTSRALDGPLIEVYATASSGLPVSFASTTPAVCRVNDNWVTMLIAGTCTLRASQPGTANYSAAVDIDQSFAVVPAYQTLTFVQPPDPQTLLHPEFLPHATASSGLPVRFSSQTPGVCTASGGIVTLVAVGKCTILAAQEGNSSFISVAVDRSFSVTSAGVLNAASLIPGPFIEYSTRLGGYQGETGSYDRAFDVVVGADGSAWVGGSVAGTYFPGLSSGTFTNGGLDLLYVAKMNPDRGEVDVATVVGARSANMTDSGRQTVVAVEAMAMDAGGTIYVAAYTNSTTYPSTGGTYTRSGPIAIHRVAANGSVQVLGAPVDTSVQTIRALSIDAAGGVYFTGVAGPGLVTTTNAAISATQAPAGGPYLIRFAPGGTSVAYATYLSVHGSRPSVAASTLQSTIDNETSGFALMVDAAGNAYVAGQAKANDFPATPGAPDTTDSENRDVFVAKVNPTGTALLWVARLGEGDAERATSIALAPDGSVVIGGKTATYPFYGTGPAFKSSVELFHASDLEIGFVAKLAADGSRWVFVAPVGSSGGNLQRLSDDREPSPIKVAVDTGGAIYAAGHTSADRALPVGGQDAFGTFVAIQSPAYYNDGSTAVISGPDSVFRARGAFLMKLTGDGSRLLYSVIVNLGRATGLALDAYGAAYVVGYQAGSPQVNAAQSAPGAVFVTKVSNQAAPVILTGTPNPAVASQSVSLSATVGDARYAGSIEFRDGPQVLATVPVAGGVATYVASLGVGIHPIKATFRGRGPFDGATSTEVIQIVDQSPPGS